MRFSFFTFRKYELKFFFISGISIFVFLFLSNLFIEETHAYEFVQTILIIIFLWIGCAFISYFLGKKYTWEKNTYIRLVMHVILILLLNAFVILFFEYLPEFLKNKTVSVRELKISALVTVLISFTVSAIGETIDALAAWKKSVMKTNQLERDNIQAQLNVLKKQVNPHFLFNSLNTLATYVQDIPEINNYVQNLSEYLRYVLTQKEDFLIPVVEELDIMNKYAFLQKARFKGNLIINCNISEDIRSNYYVPPFCVQMLLENAIKHNIVSNKKPLTVNIFTQNDKFLVVENNLQEKRAANSTNLGLKNITDRYRHFSATDVGVEKTDRFFRVLLPLIDNEKYKEISLISKKFKHEAIDN